MSERRRAQLATLQAFLARGVPMVWAARGVGLHRTTALRWLRHARRGEGLGQRRGPYVGAPSAASCAAATVLVRNLHGLIGADALRHSVAGLTRRAAAQIKSVACRDLERERRGDAQRVVVAAPGVVRGFDAMELCAPRQPRRHALIAADGCVPYRTSWVISDRYDGDSVAALLESDFAKYGPPLVLRMDRASSHAVLAVRELLQAYGVLSLQGPPYCARYYGQLERQNREHREWLAGRAPCVEDLDDMMAALNDTWRRATLGWCTASELWRRRPRLDVDRKELRDQVYERARHLEREVEPKHLPQDPAWRVAVKQTLVDRGLLRIENGGWC